MSLSVKNFDKYQHRDASRRRRGGLLFIRVDVGTRREPEFSGRGGRARYGQWCAILEWAGETGNAIPCEAGAWRREFGSHWADVVAWFVNGGKLTMSDLCPTCARLVPDSDKSRDKLVTDSDTKSRQIVGAALTFAGKAAGESAGTEEKRRDVLAKASTRRMRDDLWEALEEAMRCKPSTRIEQSRWNAALKQLRDAGATPDEITSRAAAYRREWPNVELTPHGLAANWSRFATARVETLKPHSCDDCGIRFASAARLTEHRENVHGEWANVG